MIFVFGSNLAGRHGAGAALYARKYHGAKIGVFFGQEGNSFAIPTKDEYLNTLPLGNIEYFIQQFLKDAKRNSNQQYKVTRIGCGLANLKDENIAPMFKKATPNCYFDTKWIEYLPYKNFWGTF